jgi:hypothetical protein
MTLGKEIRCLYGNNGPLDPDQVINILLALLDRIEALEAKLKEQP